MEVRGETSREVLLDAPKAEVAHYFAGNEALLRRLVRGEVHALEAGVYRVALRRYQVGDMAIAPAFDVRFVDRPDGMTMTSLDCRVLDATHADLDLSARFEGEAQYEDHPAGTLVRCRARAHARVRLPFFVEWLPASWLERAADALVAIAMEEFGDRFLSLLREDFSCSMIEPS